MISSSDITGRPLVISVLFARFVTKKLHHTVKLEDVERGYFMPL